jgi:tight adherence protein B
MSHILGSEIFFIPLFGFAVFIFAYFTSDQILNFLHKRSLGTREEVIELMDRMFMDVDKRRITMMMLLGSFGLGALCFLVTWPHVIAGLIIGALMTMLGWAAPKVIITNMWERRCSALVNQMVDGMTIMTNGIKSGQSLTQSMERVVDNMKGPLPQEFSLVLNKIRLGMATEEALVEMAERIPRADVQMFVTAVNILKETGGNLAETFSTIVTTVRERQKVEKKIEALTAQGTMQSIIISMVPFGLLVMFYVVDKSYIMPLFTRPLGWLFLFVMLTLQIIGLVVMKKIVTIKV